MLQNRILITPAWRSLVSARNERSSLGRSSRASILSQSSFRPTAPSLTTASSSNTCRYRHIIHFDSTFVCGRALASYTDRQLVTAVSKVYQQCRVLNLNNNHNNKEIKGTHPPFHTFTSIQLMKKTVHRDARTFIDLQQSEDRITDQSAIFWSGQTPASMHSRKVSSVIIDFAVLFN